MNGLIWSKDKVKSLIEIWSDKDFSEQLFKTHKNTNEPLILAHNDKVITSAKKATISPWICCLSILTNDRYEPNPGTYTAAR